MLKVFIGCLPGNSDKRELRAILDKHAKISSLSIIPESKSQDKLFCKGFAFAICASQDEAQKLLSMNGKVLYRNRYLSFRMYKKGTVLAQERADFNNRRIFIGSVPREVTETDILSTFSAYGSVENVFFIGNKKALKMKFGYVVFRDVESSLRILQEQPVIKFLGKTLRIEGYAGKKKPDTDKREAEEIDLLAEEKRKYELDSRIPKAPEDQKALTTLTRTVKETASIQPTENRSRVLSISDKSSTDSKQATKTKARYGHLYLICQQYRQVDCNHYLSNLRLNLHLDQDKVTSEAQSSSKALL